MKKILFVFVLLLCLGATFACSKPAPTTDAKSISFAQTMLYTGEGTDYSVKLSGGNGEKLFIADGKVGESGNFVKLTVSPLSRDLMNESLTYTIIGENGSVQGELAKDAFGAYFSAEPDLTQSGNPTSITVGSHNGTCEITLLNQMEGKITCSRALEIAEGALDEKLSADDAQREIYIRLINNGSDKSSPYYWYVAFIANPSDYYSALIEPTEGKVLSVNP